MIISQIKPQLRITSGQEFIEQMNIMVSKIIVFNSFSDVTRNNIEVFNLVPRVITETICKRI